MKNIYIFIYKNMYASVVDRYLLSVGGKCCVHLAKMAS